jgi:hypothetical protein
MKLARENRKLIFNIKKFLVRSIMSKQQQNANNDDRFKDIWGPGTSSSLNWSSAAPPARPYLYNQPAFPDGGHQQQYPQQYHPGNNQQGQFNQKPMSLAQVEQSMGIGHQQSPFNQHPRQLQNAAPPRSAMLSLEEVEAQMMRQHVRKPDVRASEVVEISEQVDEVTIGQRSDGRNDESDWRLGQAVANASVEELDFNAMEQAGPKKTSLKEQGVNKAKDAKTAAPALRDLISNSSNTEESKAHFSGAQSTPKSKPLSGAQAPPRTIQSTLNTKPVLQRPPTPLSLANNNIPLMTLYEKELVARIQIAQLVCQDAYHDDYYYKMFKKEEEAEEVEKADVGSDPRLWARNISKTQNGNRVLVNNAIQDQMRALIEGRKRAHRKGVAVGREGALGKVALNSTRNPRQAIKLYVKRKDDEKVEGDGSGGGKTDGDVGKAAASTIGNTRQKVLRGIEAVHNHVLALEALSRRESGIARDLRWEREEADMEERDATWYFSWV